MAKPALSIAVLRRLGGVPKVVVEGAPRRDRNVGVGVPHPWSFGPSNPAKEEHNQQARKDHASAGEGTVGQG